MLSKSITIIRKYGGKVDFGPTLLTTKGAQKLTQKMRPNNTHTRTCLVIINIAKNDFFCQWRKNDSAYFFDYFYLPRII